MNEPSIRARLASIEEQIKVLKAELDVKPKRKKPKRFADLYGTWKGKVDLTLEEIKTAEIKLRGDE
jgi:hypothetical protein